jgi:hypothetical protein
LVEFCYTIALIQQKSRDFLVASEDRQSCNDGDKKNNFHIDYFKRKEKKTGPLFSRLPVQAEMQEETN